MNHSPTAAAPPPPGYGLPPLPSLPCPEFRGPTPWSNWIIKGRLLAGAYPASLDDAETQRILTTLLELGVNTFVCLQAEFSLHTPDAAWRSGQGLRPYIKDAQQILIRARETRSQRIMQDKLDFLHLPIIDGNVTSDVALSRLADDCCIRILRGERMYIHCWGGHGRTGTLVAVMLGRLYSVTCAAALRFTQAFHDSRKFPQGVRSPQTTPQVAQVKRLLPDPPSLRGVVYPRDPSLVLDDGAIVRPPSAAAALAAVKVAASGSASSRQGSVHGVGAGGAGAAGAGPAAAGLAACGVAAGVDMEVEEGQVLPPVPINQQRKDAIKAKQGGGGGGGGGAPSAATGAPASASGLTQALQAASLDAREAEEAAGGPAPAPGSSQRTDWLQSVFDKGQSKLAALRAGGGSIPATHSKPAPPPSDAMVQQQQQQQEGGYLKQYMEQQQQLAAAAPGSAPPKPGAGKAAGAGGQPVIAITASSRGLPPGVALFEEEDSQAVDMRPSKVTVAVPEAGAERSASSMARMLNYFSGRSTPTR
ncbi:hypothetical protein CHLNCDRAFT_143577 [Chlorella variabilis]|uniref:Tyrosine specific protein phosphatases domain-containing protein n=1 Tax=Chlorella variabilis TaxID=554065 RepID=E1ZB79_CHLVA|nr:hypothetical protein CHLNCDRAFT_143577 [Chlorella variabilis]EFN57179.1 hypothetical protein CHLNCDRAFT_143577 [Chlorella variabilis]|eukprot:XP_005849281.1 hypothetical protein CHLNCDRAFT_143577 [Chlorella variabilis]